MDQFPCVRGCEQCLKKLCTRWIPMFGLLLHLPLSRKLGIKEAHGVIHSINNWTMLIRNLSMLEAGAI